MSDAATDVVEQTPTRSDKAPSGGRCMLLLLPGLGHEMSVMRIGGI